MSLKDNNLQNVRPFEDRLYRKQNAVTLRVVSLLKKKGWKRKELAQKMGVKEGSLSRMLGMIGSNLTLETISKMEIALDDDLLITPEEADYKIIEDLNKADRLHMIAAQRAIQRPFPHKTSNLTLNREDLPPQDSPNIEKSFAEIITEGSTEKTILSTILNQKEFTKWPHEQSKK